MLEVVGVTGVVHLGQIQSGLRSATRIAQGGHIKIRLNTDLPVQVDGEPWIQSPGDVVVLKSALKVMQSLLHTFILYTSRMLMYTLHIHNLHLLALFMYAHNFCLLDYRRQC